MMPPEWVTVPTIHCGKCWMHSQVVSLNCLETSTAKLNLSADSPKFCKWSQNWVVYSVEFKEQVLKFKELFLTLFLFKDMTKLIFFLYSVGQTKVLTVTFLNVLIPLPYYMVMGSLQKKHSMIQTLAESAWPPLPSP